VSKTTRVTAGLLSGVIAITAVIAPLLQPKKAYSAPLVATCSNTWLDTWDWPADLKRGQRTGGTDGAGLNVGNVGYDFSPENTSYIIFRATSNETSSPKRNLFTIYTASNNAKLSIYQTAFPASTPQIRSTNQTTPLIYGSEIRSEPRDKTVPGFYVWPAGFPDVDTYPTANNTNPGGVTLTTGNTYCVYAAKNVIYESTWSYNKFSSYAGYKAGADASASCTTLDFACKIKQAWEGVADTFSAVGEAIVYGIAQIFAPDGNQIKSDFDSLTSFLETKFGFLTYPFVFISNIFNAFNNTSNNWCTTSSCSKDFGNFFGQPFIINITQLKTSVPTYYNWFVIVMRGMVVLALLLSLRQKFVKVLHK